MPSLDLILIIALFVISFLGFVFGFVYSFGVLVGTVVSAVIAGYSMEPVAQAMKFVFFGDINVSRVVMFILIFVLVSNLFGLFFWFINKVFKLVSILPFIKTINRTGGAFLGFLVASFTLGMILFIILRYPIDDGIIQAMIDSKVAKGLLVFAKVLSPLLPESVRDISTVLDS